LLDVTAMHWEPNVANPRVFVVEKGGRILVFPDRNDVTDNDVKVFLDWRNPIPTARDPEKTYNRGGRFAMPRRLGRRLISRSTTTGRTRRRFVTYNTAWAIPRLAVTRRNLTRFTVRNGTAVDTASKKVLIRPRSAARRTTVAASYPPDREAAVRLDRHRRWIPARSAEQRPEPGDAVRLILRLDVDRDADGVGYASRRTTRS
jgi:hypothetical protein